MESYTSYTTTIKFVTSNKYVVGCYSIIEPNAYIQFLYQDPHQLSAGQQFYNIAQYNRHGLLAVIPHSWSTNFDSRLTAYINYITSRGKVNDLSFNKNTFGTRLVLTNNIILDRKRTAALQLNASYNSDILMGYSYNEEMFENDSLLDMEAEKHGMECCAQMQRHIKHLQTLASDQTPAAVIKSRTIERHKKGEPNRAVLPQRLQRQKNQGSRHIAHGHIKNRPKVSPTPLAHARRKRHDKKDNYKQDRPQTAASPETPHA